MTYSSFNINKENYIVIFKYTNNIYLFISLKHPLLKRRGVLTYYVIKPALDE